MGRGGAELSLVTQDVILSSPPELDALPVEVDLGEGLIPALPRVESRR